MSNLYLIILQLFRRNYYPVHFIEQPDPTSMDLNMNPLNVEFPATSISLEDVQKTEEVTVLPVSPEQNIDKSWGKVR